MEEFFLARINTKQARLQKKSTFACKYTYDCYQFPIIKNAINDSGTQDLIRCLGKVKVKK